MIITTKLTRRLLGFQNQPYGIVAFIFFVNPFLLNKRFADFTFFTIKGSLGSTFIFLFTEIGLRFFSVSVSMIFKLLNQNYVFIGFTNIAL
jgi:hypothetical protein